MTSSDGKTTETTKKPGQDLAAVNEVGRMEYEPGAYLADGAEFLQYAKARLGDLKSVSNGGRQHEYREVSLLYPTSGADGPLSTQQIPISGLVLELPPIVGSEKDTLTHGRLLFGGTRVIVGHYVGVPVGVHQVLQKIIECASFSIRPCFTLSWCPTKGAHDNHHWMYARVDKPLQGTVYVDGKPNKVDLEDLLKEVNKNVKCDAFVTVRVLQTENWEWKLQMTLKEVLVTGTTDVQSHSHSFCGGELIGRQKYSSPEIVSAFNKLQK